MSDEVYELDDAQLEAIIRLTIDAARDAWHWEEGIDMPVLRLRVKEFLRGEE